MNKFIKVKLAAVKIDHDQQEQFEAMGINKDCSEPFDAECYINVFSIEAFYENQDFESKQASTIVILSGGAELPILMDINDFKKLISKF